MFWAFNRFDLNTKTVARISTFSCFCKNLFLCIQGVKRLSLFLDLFSALHFSLRSISQKVCYFKSLSFCRVGVWYLSGERWVLPFIRSLSNFLFLRNVFATSFHWQCALWFIGIFLDIARCELWILWFIESLTIYELVLQFGKNIFRGDKNICDFLHDTSLTGLSISPDHTFCWWSLI